jgi:hypothetical protein
MAVSPFNNADSYQYRHRGVKFEDCNEPRRAGPPLYKLTINGREEFRGKRFSLPFIALEAIIIVPVYKKGKFNLSRIDLDDFRMTEIKLSEDLILLKDVKGDTITYYSDAGNSLEKKARISDFAETRLWVNLLKGVGEFIGNIIPL